MFFGARIPIPGIEGVVQPECDLHTLVERRGEGDVVEVRGRSFAGTLPVGPGRLAEASFETAGPGFVYHDTFLHVLELRSRREPGGEAAASFVTLELEVRPR
jgi:hypothetical protein